MEPGRNPQRILFSRYLLGYIVEHNNNVSFNQMKAESVNNIFTEAFFFVSYYLLLYTGVIQETQINTDKMTHIIESMLPEIEQETGYLSVPDLEEVLLWNTEDMLLEFCQKHNLTKPGKKKVTILRSIICSKINLEIILTELAIPDILQILAWALKLNPKEHDQKGLIKKIVERTYAFK
jgi:hypothetical protein